LDVQTVSPDAQLLMHVAKSKQLVSAKQSSYFVVQMPSALAREHETHAVQSADFMSQIVATGAPPAPPVPDELLPDALELDPGPPQESPPSPSPPLGWVVPCAQANNTSANKG
jgi:hypothetical protein